MERFEQAWAIGDTVSGRNWLPLIRRAAIKNDAVIEVYDNERNEWRNVRLKGTQFLTKDWGPAFSTAKSHVLKILRLLHKDDPSDEELKTIVRAASEAQMGLRVIVDVLDDFDAFCKSNNTKIIMESFYPNVEVPAVVGPIDRSPIDKLSATSD
jgi:hypothetical protein